MDRWQIFFRFISRKPDICFYYKEELGIYVECGCLAMDMTLCVDLDINFLMLLSHMSQTQSLKSMGVYLLTVLWVKSLTGDL